MWDPRTTSLRPQKWAAEACREPARRCPEGAKMAELFADDHIFLSTRSMCDETRVPHCAPLTIASLIDSIEIPSFAE
jgi:hypothetical protein